MLARVSPSEPPPSFSSAARAQHQVHHGLDDHARGGYPAHVGPLMDVDGLVAGGQCPRHG